MPDRDSQGSLLAAARAEAPRPGLESGDREPLATAVLPAPSPLANAEDGQEEAAARYRRRVLLVLCTLVAALGLYWASGYIFAYTDDAYVTSDLVGVAPQVSGRIVAVHIVDNQSVTQGSLLATIDPTPFQLALDEEQAKRAEAEAQLAVDRDLIASAQARHDEAAAKGWGAP